MPACNIAGSIVYVTHLLAPRHARIECLPQVYYLRGSPLVYSTLMAASIGTAHAIAILVRGLGCQL